MGRFIDAEQATVARINTNEVSVSRPITYTMSLPGGGEWQCVIPMGFISDLGSVPWYLRWAFKPDDPQCMLAYLLHDYILWLIYMEWKLQSGVTEQFAAAVFYDAMRASGVPRWSRMLQFLGVSLMTKDV